MEQANVSGPKQVEIEAKFVEITQNNLKELGFDWLLGQFNVGDQTRLWRGRHLRHCASGEPGRLSVSSTPGGVPVGQFPGHGWQSQRESCHQRRMLSTRFCFGIPGASSLAPGIFGIGGVFTDPQFQVVVRALNQKKGVDLLSAPRVTTKSGQRAVIEIVREFRYPTQFEPPQIPQTVGSTGMSAVSATGHGCCGGSAAGHFP